MIVRPARIDDLESIALLCSRLWPEASAEQHRDDVRALLTGEPRATLPLALFVGEHEGRVIGFVEVGLRSNADGCDPARPCGFIEGWYVVPEHRRRGTGRSLIERAEAWARAQGCTELASDTWIDAEESQRAHAAVGFEVVDRCVNYRKAIGDDGIPGAGVARHYGADLARVHHEHFGMVARAAARELLARLSRAGCSSGTIVDLAAGTGLLSRAVCQAGFAAWGVDISEDMLRIARSVATEATFTSGSLWDVALPPCVAVAAVGEAFGYAADCSASLGELERRLADIRDALAPGGLLLFDFAGPGRSGPGGSRRAFWTLDRAHLGLEEQEDERAGLLTRAITLFVPDGDRYRHTQETHVLRLHVPEDVERSLTRCGFSWERLRSYDDLCFTPGWHAYAAKRVS